MVLVRDVVVGEADGIKRIEFSMEEIEDVEGNMDHPIEEVGVDMDGKKEWLIGEDKTMNMKENIDHPMGGDMGEKKEWNKTPDVVENFGEDKTLADMG